MVERNEAFICITPRPVFARLERSHDRVLSLVKMFRRVLVTRRIAASDMPALETHPQMYPFIIVLHALFATVGRSWLEDRRAFGVLARFER